MIQNKHDEQLICHNHNLPLEYLNPDQFNSNQLYVCGQCFIEYHKAIPIRSIKQSNQRQIEQFEYQLNQNSNIWNNSIISLISLKKVFIETIKIIENIIDGIRNQIKSTTNEFKNMNLNHMEEIKQAHESYIQTQLIHQINIIQQMEGLKQSNSIDKLIQGLKEINLQKFIFDGKNWKINIQQLNVIRYEYQLIPESSIKQDEECGAIAFNYDGSIIIAGCDKLIQVFEFKNKQLNKVQSLQGHQKYVNFLKFMKKSNQFISGSIDGIIKVWKVNKKNQCISIQTLEVHEDSINCLIVNQNDDLIGSGSDDQSIILWKLNGNKWQLAQQIQCQSIVYSLSFNDSSTKLISCEENKLIQVFQHQGETWIISQQIKVETEGVRLCFIGDDQFVFLPWESNYLQYYIFDLHTNEFKKQLEVEVSDSNDDNFGFSINFVKRKNLLIVKNFQFVNVFRKQGNQKFIQDQYIEFQTSELFGDINEDGDFMVTWDNSTKEYQVRNLKEVQ